MCGRYPRVKRRYRYDMNECPILSSRPFPPVLFPIYHQLACDLSFVNGDQHSLTCADHFVGKADLMTDQS